MLYSFEYVIVFVLVNFNEAPADPVTLVTNFENGVGRGVGTFLGSCPRGEGVGGYSWGEAPCQNLPR